MIERIYIRINSNLFLSHTETNGFIIKYPKNSIMFFLWGMMHDKDDRKQLHFNNLQQLIT